MFGGVVMQPFPAFLPDPDAVSETAVSETVSDEVAVAEGEMEEAEGPSTSSVSVVSLFLW